MNNSQHSPAHTERLTADQAALLLDVSTNRIAQWKHAGQVEVIDSLQAIGPGRRVPLYLLGELRPLAAAYHRRRAARALTVTSATSSPALDGGAA